MFKWNWAQHYDEKFISMQRGFQSADSMQDRAKKDWKSNNKIAKQIKVDLKE